MAVRTIVVNPNILGSDLSFQLPPGVTLDVESVYAAIDTSLSGPTGATLTIQDSSGAVIAKRRQGETVDAGITTGSATWALRLGDSGGEGYNLIEQAGFPLTRRHTIDFNGAGVVVTDDPANQATRVTIDPPAAGGYVLIEDEGVPLDQRQIINFLGAGVTAVDNPGNASTDVTIPGGGGANLLRYDALTQTFTRTGVGPYTWFPDWSLATVTLVNSLGVTFEDDGGWATKDVLNVGASAAWYRVQFTFAFLIATATALSLDDTTAQAGVFGKQGTWQSFPEPERPILQRATSRNRGVNVYPGFSPGASDLVMAQVFGLVYAYNGNNWSSITAFGFIPAFQTPATLAALPASAVCYGLIERVQTGLT